MKATESELKEALHIASVVMQSAGLCRYDDPAKCRVVYPDEGACERCIERWLISRSRKNIRAKMQIDLSGDDPEVEEAAVSWAHAYESFVDSLETAPRRGCGGTAMQDRGYGMVYQELPRPQACARRNRK